MKTTFLFVILLLFTFSSFGQSVDTNDKKQGRIKRYKVNYWVSGSIIGVGMVSDYFAIGRLKRKPSMSDADLAFWNSAEQKDLINSIDRWALQQDPSEMNLWKDISDYGQTLTFLLPALLVIDKKIRKDWLDLLLMYVEGHTITFTFYNYSPLGPTFQNRWRPMIYYTEIDLDARKSGHNLNSFYSGHTASTAYSSFFMAKVYCDYHPELGAKKYLFYLAASVPPLVVGYARITALSHFPSDVAVGFALGAIIGILLPEIHKNRKFKDYSLGMFTSPYGNGLTVGWNLSKPPHGVPEH